MVGRRSCKAGWIIFAPARTAWGRLRGEGKLPHSGTLVLGLGVDQSRMRLHCLEGVIVLYPIEEPPTPLNMAG